MEGFSVDRFREEEFSQKEFLEEVYTECKREGAKKAEEILQEMDKIKEALEYKENELLSIAEESVSREEVEEMANSLSSIKLSAESKTFLEIASEKALFQKKLSFVKYVELLESSTLLEEVKHSETAWECLAEFLNVAEQVEELDAKAKEAVAEAKSCLVLSAKGKYAHALEEGDYEQAGTLAGILFVLECREYPIDCLLGNKSTEYIHTLVDKLDLVETLNVHTLTAYMESIADEVAKKTELCKAILMKKEKVDEGEYSRCLFRLFKQTVETMVSPVLEDILQVEDPFEYLAKVEYAAQQLEEIKESACRANPRYKDKIKHLNFLKTKPEECCRREVEGVHLLLNGFAATLQGKSTLKHTIQGECITAEPKTAFELVFRFLAVCRKAVLRARVLKYPQQVLEMLVKSQTAGHSLLLSQVCTAKDPRPFSLVSVHLSVYLCIKKMYTDVSTPETASVLADGIAALSRTENTRSKQIFSREKAALLKAMQKSLDAFSAQGALGVLEKALKFLGGSPLFDTAADAVMKEHVLMVKTKVLTRTAKDSVKKLVIYIKEIRKFSKVLELVHVEKSLSRLRTLSEALLVDSDDMQRLLDSVSATPEEVEQVKKARMLLSK
ncbi:hypothetical protein NECID01_0952 [Nematocida sp. AWRm77]|nr:hypothetical protein NECID01_0952 [Nematocida sp. AWRm77]